MRTCPSPVDLGRIILKLARKRILKGQRPWMAVTVAGHEILQHYGVAKAVPKMQKEFSHVVANLSLSVSTQK